MQMFFTMFLAQEILESETHSDTAFSLEREDNDQIIT